MKVWLIKHRGKNWFGNMEHSHSVEIGKDKFWAQLCFYRKKDATSYLHAKLGDNKKHWHVVGATLDHSKHDNRKRL